MRSVVAFLGLMLLVACWTKDEDLVIIEDLVERSSEPACVEVRTEGDHHEVPLLKTLDDTLIAALLPIKREVLLLRSDLSLRERVRYERYGPGRVIDPQDIVLVDDTILVFSDRATRKLVSLGLGGEERGEIDLDFPPDRVVGWDDGFLVTSLILTPEEEMLLFLVRGDERRELDIPALPNVDWQMKTLENLVSLHTYPDGRIVLVHRFLSPTARVVRFPADPGADPVVASLPLPIPDGVKQAVGWMPSRPFSEDELMGILVPAMDVASDPSTGDLLYLTRTGRRVGEYMEKVVVRIDRDFAYQSSHILPANVVEMAYLPRSGELITIDEDGAWGRCALASSAGE